jgi:hypothetical protein
MLDDTGNVKTQQSRIFEGSTSKSANNTTGARVHNKYNIKPINAMLSEAGFTPSIV